jgi:hypothetical protein
MAFLETRVLFTYSAGTARMHWRPQGRAIGTWSPSDPAERDFTSAAWQQADGKWFPLAGSWCRAAFDAADEIDFVEALPDWEDV